MYSIDALLILVILELLFAICIGIACIIFSCNLLRAVSATNSSVAEASFPEAVSRRSFTKSLSSGSFKLIVDDSSTLTGSPLDYSSLEDGKSNMSNISIAKSQFAGSRFGEAISTFFNYI